MVAAALGDVHDRHLEDLLQGLAPVLPVAGLDHGVVRLAEAHHPVQHRDGGEVALEVALDGLGAEAWCQSHDLGARARGSPRLLSDRVGHGLGGVDVDDKYPQTPLLPQYERFSPLDGTESEWIRSDHYDVKEL